MSNTLLINGQWLGSHSARTLDVRDPSTGRAFASLARGDSADVALAVQAARRAFEGSWGRSTATERGRILSKAAALIEANADSLAETESLDTGKSIEQARAEIGVAARYFEYYGGAADKWHGQVIPYLADYEAQLVYEPLGVTAHIIPWNYPAVMAARTITPALAAGNAVVLKPSEDACLSVLGIAQLLAQAGLPTGALNVVTGLGAEAGAALSAHPGIDFLSFTGSPAVGSLVQQAAAVHHVRCVVELGGKSPQIVFDDADFEAALPTIVQAILQNAGQTCSAGSRVLLQQGRYAEWSARLGAVFAQAQAGPPGSGARLGPLINAKQQRRVQHYIDSARADGVGILGQGQLHPLASEAGFYIAPICFGPVPPAHALAQEEIFGPVLSVLPFGDEAQALALANGTPYGLAAGVWSRDASRQRRLARGLRCGQVFLNSYGAGAGVELPFGGVGKSGHGREKGFLALAEVTRSKTIVQYFAAEGLQSVRH